MMMPAGVVPAKTTAQRGVGIAVQPIDDTSVGGDGVGGVVVVGGGVGVGANKRRLV